MISSISSRPKRRPRRTGARKRPRRPFPAMLVGVVLLLGAAAVFAMARFHARYTLGLQAPLHLRFQWPLVISARMSSADAARAEADQGRPLTAYQQYACRKFGSACRIALAIQRAENARGACEVWHYNSDGTLDWGYFQINTVHLTRPGMNLRNLLDCRSNIDFAYQLYSERGFQPWTTFNSGAYRNFMRGD